MGAVLGGAGVVRRHRPGRFRFLRRHGVSGPAADEGGVLGRGLHRGADVRHRDPRGPLRAPEDRGRADDRPFPGRGDDPHAGLDVAVRRVDGKGPRAERKRRPLVSPLGDLPLPRRVRRGLRAGRGRVDPPRARRRGHRSGGDMARHAGTRGGVLRLPEGRRGRAPRGGRRVLRGAGARRKGRITTTRTCGPAERSVRWTIPSTAAWTSTDRRRSSRRAREGSSGARNPWGGTTSGFSGICSG